MTGQPAPAADNLLAQGHAALRASRPVDAIRHLTVAASRQPAHPGIRHLLGIALEQTGDLTGAVAAFRSTLALAPGQTDAAVRAAGILLRQGERQPAADLLLSAAAVADDPLAAGLCRARGLGLLERHSEAAAELRAVLARQPAHAEAWRLLGNTLATSGDMAAARDAFRRAVALAPDDAAAVLDLVRAGRVQQADRPLVDAAAAALARASQAPRRQVLLGFALGKAFDDLGEPEQAMRAFDQANAIRARQVPFDADALTADVSRIIATFPAPPAPAGPGDERAIIIVGMPRSGTTLLEQILSSHPDVAAGGELGFWGSAGQRWLAAGTGDVPALRREHASALDAISATAARVTDKNPFNFAWLGLIQAVLPNAAIIHCRRDPRDTCLSAYMTLFTGGHAWAASRSGLVAFYRQYQRLMAHWRAVLPSHRFLEVDYESVVADPEAAARQLVAFCGLPWHAACLRPEANARAVHTASVFQARQPVHQHAVGRWRAYAPWLGELAALAA